MGDSLEIPDWADIDGCDGASLAANWQPADRKAWQRGLAQWWARLDEEEN